MPYYILVGKPEAKMPLKRSKGVWKDYTEMDLIEIGYVGVNWVYLAQDRRQ
jgi:hypothetical protein